MLILLIQACFTVVYSKWDLFMNLQDVKETDNILDSHQFNPFSNHMSLPVSFVLAAPVNASL